VSKTRRRLAVCIAILAVSMVPAGSVSQKQPTPPVYTVVPHDTLWHISERFLQDPFRWQELWNANRHIVNPHLIYPGDQVVVDPHAPTVQAEKQETDVTPPPAQAAPRERWMRAAPNDEAADATTKDADATTVDGHAGAYVDKLIDPSVEQDSYKDQRHTRQAGGAWRQIEHSLELISHYRDDDVYFDSSIDYGLQYIARLSTRNWGQLRLNVVALDEFNDYDGAIGTGNGFYRPQSGIERVSLEQYNLPITENVYMNNIIGTHRQVRINPFRARPNLINYRFSAAEPDIRGVSSQLKFGHTGIGMSVGELGQTRGSILPGFEETEGDVKRVDFTQVFARHAVSAQAWRTDDQSSIDNRSGYRLAYDLLWGDNTMFSISTVASDDNRATLFGGSTQNAFSRHDYGAYHFDADILWIDTRIGDDNAGGFYRYHNQQGTVTWGTSIELRRDGLSLDRSEQTDTAYFSVNVSNRLNRRNAVSGTYSYRRADSQDDFDRSEDEHTLRGYLTRIHRADARSNVSVSARSRADARQVDLTYGWTKNLPDDSAIELESSVRNTFGSSDARANEVLLNGRWSKQFLNGSFVALGLGYSFGSSDFDDNQGINGYLNFESPLTSRLAVSLQIDYSRNRTEYEDEDLTSLLFTNSQLDDDDLREYREFSALFSIRYHFGGSTGPSILASRGRNSGAGQVQGYVFVDANGDGVRQASEAGVEGITLFLNSVYPLVTNARGEYSIPNVGLGEHFIFIDESTLPLPWALSNGEYLPISVHLRQTSRVDIPISAISLSEADD